MADKTFDVTVDLMGDGKNYFHAGFHDLPLDQFQTLEAAFLSGLAQLNQHPPGGSDPGEPRVGVAVLTATVVETGKDGKKHNRPKPFLPGLRLPWADLRVSARKLGIEKLEAGAGKAFLKFSLATPLRPEYLVRIIQGSRGRIRMVREFTVEARIPTDDWRRTRESLLQLFQELQR